MQWEEDFGPSVTVPASLKILKKYENISIVLVGDSGKINEILKKREIAQSPKNNNTQYNSSSWYG